MDNVPRKADTNNSEVSPASGIGEDLALIAPNTNPDSTDIRCGRNASLPWSSVETAVVNAGSTIGFAAGEPGLPVYSPIPLLHIEA